MPLFGKKSHASSGESKSVTVDPAFRPPTVANTESSGSAADENNWQRVRLAHRKHVAGRRRGSVVIAGDDAAVTSRGVALSTELSRRSSSRRPSLDDQFGAAGTVEAMATAVAKRVRNQILEKGSEWYPPDERAMGSLDYLISDEELILLCENACEKRFWCDSALVEVRAPVKVFGDLHGQFGDLLRFFEEYGAPEPYGGDVGYVSYLFLGDYVDRGTLSLECVALLLAIKTCHPEQVTLLRGNHEDRDVNADFGFQQECVRRCRQGMAVWEACNLAFDMLPLSAVIDGSILCLHGGLGGSVRTLQQLRELPRPFAIEPEAQDETTIVVYDVLWSDPTENDEIHGVRPNARGEGVVRYGPDRVREFCDANSLQLVLRAHECVWDGFEYFAQGQLLTVFSCPDYGGKYDNDGAMLVVNRNLEVMPKVICSRQRAPSTPVASPPHSASASPAAQRGRDSSNSGSADGDAARLDDRLAQLDLPQGLWKEVLHPPPASAQLAVEGAMATVHFTVSLPDGTLLHDSRQGEPLEFRVGAQPSEAVLGWDLVLPEMRVGEIVRLRCAPKYAYGERGAPPLIPPDATLVFELELVRLRDEPRPHPEDDDDDGEDDAGGAAGAGASEAAEAQWAPPERVLAASTWEQDPSRPPTPPRERPAASKAFGSEDLCVAIEGTEARHAVPRGTRAGAEKR